MSLNDKRSLRPTSLIQSLLSPVWFTLSFSLILCFSASAQTIMQKTQRSVYTRIDKNVGGYLESLPIDYSKNPTKKYPLIIFLHGVGERGNGSAGLLEKVANVGIAKLLRVGMFPAYHTYGGQTHSFIVLSPQLESASGWPTDIQAIIDYAKRVYRVDESRIYLTGLSLGGIMGWIYATSSVTAGQKLAASLLICPGASATAFQLKNISSSQLPVWVTNNDQDPFNPASGATALVNAINNTVPAPPKALLTIFHRNSHDAWSATYDPNFRQGGLNVYEWMLSKTRGSQPTPPTPVLTASAGTNQSITLPANTATLDASGSKVTSGKITSYTWTKLSGPSTGLLSLLLSGLQAKLTGLVEGVYKYQLTVKDSNGGTATATVTVTVNANTASTTPPTVNAGSGATITLPTSSVTLDGSASKAATGNTINSYKWVKYSGPSAGTISSPTSVKTAVTALAAGTYIFNLTVTDNRGQSKTGGTTVIVKAAATSTDPPIANAGKGGTITLPANTFTLDGSASKASTGNTIRSYLWAKSSGPSGGTISTPAGVKTEIKGLLAGTYIFTLTVTDSRGQSKTGGTTIIVKTAATSTDPPIANAGKGGTITLPANTFTLDGSASKASTGNTIRSYLWAKSSGPSGGTISTPAGAKTEIKGLLAGTYIFTLTVTDSRGQSKTGGTTVIVKPAATSAPIADAGKDGTITLPTNTFVLDGSLSKAAPGNTLESGQWTKVSGPAPGSITNSTSRKATATGLVAGAYVFRLTVTDNHGVINAASVTVIVKAAASSSAPPTAKVGQSVINLMLPANAITLDGSSSIAASGNKIVSYEWEKYTGPSYDGIKTPTSAKIALTGLVAGSYGFTLTVKDNNGRTSSVNVAVIVKATTNAAPPTAKVAQSVINLTLPSNAATLDGSSSIAASGNNIVSYEWKKYTGPSYDGIKTPTSAKIALTGLVAGSYGFMLTVKDNNGRTSSVDVAVIVKKSSASARMAEEDSTAQSRSISPDLFNIQAGDGLDVIISPNPVISDMNVLVKGNVKGNTNLIIYSLDGKPVQQQSFLKDGVGSLNKSFNLSRYPAGIYIVQVIVDGKYKKAIRVVKR
jgi:poly(3-hydroxybutyrate) depolymerase